MLALAAEHDRAFSITAALYGDAHRALYEKVQGEDADACGEEAPPEDRGRIE